MDNMMQIHRTVFSDVECEAAIRILKEIAPDRFCAIDEDVPSEMENEEVGEEYNGGCVHHPQYINCKFHGTKFNGINGIASNILNCYFSHAQFIDAGMTFSDFSGTHFVDGTTFTNCGFSENTFEGVRFADTTVVGCDFDKSFFSDAIFCETEFFHSSFEDVQFHNVKFENCDLIHANFEYSSFLGVQFKHSNLPLLGILNSFGGLQAVAQNPDSTIQYSDGGPRLSSERFFNLLPSLQAYFYKNKEYFALANANIYFGNQKGALYYIMIGLKESLELRDFRMIRYLCKLASLNHFFTIRELRQLYEALVNNSQITSMSDHQYQVYLREITEIKRLLIDNPFSQPQMVITCSTNLEPDDYDGLAALCSYFEQAIQKQLPQCSYYYSVRHNSPPSVDYFLSDVLPNLYAFVSMITISLLGLSQGATLIDKIEEIKAKHLKNKVKKNTKNDLIQQEKLKTEQMSEQLRQEKLRTDLMEEQVRKVKLENQKSELEIQSTWQQKGLWLPADTAELQKLQGKVESVRFTVQSSNPETVPLRDYTFYSAQKRQGDCQ